MQDETYIYSYPSQSTAKIGQEVPFNIQYQFTRILNNVSESMLPFIKPILLTNRSNNTSIENVKDFYPWRYGKNYYEFDGDATKVYHGFNPTSRSFFVDDEEDDFNINFTSTWFGIDLYFTTSTGGNRELRNGTLDYCVTNWGKTVLSINYGTESVPDWQDVEVSSYKFATRAIDNIDSSYVTGTGTYAHSPYVEEGSTIVKYQTILNYTTTAHLFRNDCDDNSTTFWASGLLYVEGVFNTSYSLDFPFIVTFPPNNFVSMTVRDEGAKKLFWSNKRAYEFRYNAGTRLLFNTPTTFGYETATLPYAVLTSKQNVGDWPQTEQDEDPSFYYSHQRMMFIKISENNFALRVSGAVVGAAQAHKEVTGTRPFQNETYNQTAMPGGTEYTLISENRDPKTIVTYVPEPDKSNLKFKLLISYLPSLSESQSKDIKNDT